MRSESNRGRGGVRLKFEIGTDMTRVMLDVVSRLNTLPPLPPDADEPQVFGGDNFQTENAASLLVRPLPGHSVPDIAVEYQNSWKRSSNRGWRASKACRASTSRAGARAKCRSASIRTGSLRSASRHSGWRRR